MADRASQRRFAADPFVVDGLGFVKDHFSQISDPRLAVRVAVWICTAQSIQGGDSPEYNRWEAMAFELAEKAGGPGDSLAVGVAAMGRRVWLGASIGPLSRHKQRLDGLAKLDSIDCRAGMAWLAASAHGDLLFEPNAGGTARAVALADCLERANREGIDAHATPLTSAEFFRQLASGKLDEARACLHQMAPLAYRLAPYDAWMLWLYRAVLDLATGESEAAMLDAGRALTFARQSGVPHAVFWAKLAIARAFGAAVTAGGVWRRLADARREARNLQSDALVALCRLASAIVAARLGRTTRAAALARRALQDIGTGQMLRPVLFTSADFRIALSCVKVPAEIEERIAMLRSVHARGRDNASSPGVRPSRRVEIRCLGGFSVKRDDSVLAWPRKTPRRPLDLLKATIAHGAKGAPVAKLIDALWPDMDGDRAHRAFGTALYRLRGLIGEEVLELSAGVLTLDGTQAWVDVFEFEETTAVAGLEHVAHGRQFMSLYEGVFLPGQEDVWAAAARDRLRELFRAAVRKKVEQLLVAGYWHDALDYVEAALVRDPLSETFYQRAIAACSAGGLRAEAAAYYERCRDALSGHLGINPSAKTESLYREALRTVT